MIDPTPAAVVTGTGLPHTLTSFVGRRRELAEIKRLLAAHRLVTLTGLGGVGKSRLALQLARGVPAPHGVWLVELDRVEGAFLRTPEHAITYALGLDGPVSRGRIIEHLDARRALLVLDNCEHVRTECASTVDALLRGTSQLRVVVTSRHALGLIGEAIVNVPPMDVPRTDGGGNPPAEFHRVEAVRLFLDRAAATLPGFRLTAENAEAVAEICRRAEGLPLAIELAAGRLRSLSPRQIAERQPRSARLWTIGAHVGPQRQRSLWQSIQWSYHLCSAEERTLWARLSVFTGDFPLDAAEAVCWASDLDRGAVADVLAGLVDKSIVVASVAGPAARYRLPAAWRAYGAERLAERGEYATVSRRHRLWYEGLVTRARRQWISPHQAYWSSRLPLEAGDIGAAIDRSLAERTGSAAALYMTLSLPEVCWWSPPLLRHLAPAVEHLLVVAARPSAGRARALLMHSEIEATRGRRASAERSREEAEVIARVLSDPALFARAERARAWSALVAGDLPAAITALERALREGGRASAGHDRLTAVTLLAIAGALAGDAERTAACRDELLSRVEPFAENLHRSCAFWASGFVAWRAGDLDSATQDVRRSLRLKIGLEDDVGLSWCLETMAWIAAAQGFAERAVTLMGAASAHRTRSTIPIPSAPVWAHHAQYERRLTRALPTNTYASAFQHGRRLSTPLAISYALDETHLPLPRLRTSAARRDTPRLTDREMQVAELVARGLTDKQIAQRLSIARRTAESHVAHILLKLELTGRSQVASWYTARGARRVDHGSIPLTRAADQPP